MDKQDVAALSLLDVLHVPSIVSSLGMAVGLDTGAAAAQLCRGAPTLRRFGGSTTRSGEEAQATSHADMPVATARLVGDEITDEFDGALEACRVDDPDLAKLLSSLYAAVATDPFAIDQRQARRHSVEFVRARVAAGVDLAVARAEVTDIVKGLYALLASAK